MDVIAFIDVIRGIYIAISGILCCILAWRATRWMAKYNEPAWLHLAAMFYAACAVSVGITQLGKPITLIFPLNVLGTLCLCIFIWNVPEKKAQTWREQRGDPPDWDSRFDEF